MTKFYVFNRMLKFQNTLKGETFAERNFREQFAKKNYFARINFREWTTKKNLAWTNFREPEKSCFFREDKLSRAQKILFILQELTFPNFCENGLNKSLTPNGCLNKVRGSMYFQSSNKPNKKKEFLQIEISEQ